MNANLIKKLAILIVMLSHVVLAQSGGVPGNMFQGMIENILLGKDVLENPVECDERSANGFWHWYYDGYLPEPYKPFTVQCFFTDTSLAYVEFALNLGILPSLVLQEATEVIWASTDKYPYVLILNENTVSAAYHLFDSTDGNYIFITLYTW